MKSLVLALMSVLAVSAHADDCVDSIYKLHDALTSKSAGQVTAAFSAVTLVDKLGQEKLMKNVFDAYVNSEEYKASNQAYFSAIQATSGACAKKSMDCKKAIAGIVNAINAPKNEYGKALAANELVKTMNDGELFAASQKNLDAATTAYAAAAANALQPATKACR